MSERYPDSTLDVKFQSIEDKMDDHFEATTKVLAAIVEQTTKTNGSVRTLQKARAFMTGGIAVLTVVVVPAVGYLAYQVIQSSQKIAAVAAVLRTLTH